MTELVSTEAKTLSHQGKQLRLSLPSNDHRQSLDLQDKPNYHYTSANPSYTFQTIETTSLEQYDDNEMRVVCSIADRAQWEQHLRLLRENRLRALGVGATEPAMLSTIKPASDPGRINWTGLHTPATSTDTMAPIGVKRNADHLNEDSIITQLAALRARQKEIADSIQGHQAGETMQHVRNLSQRDLVHRRLNSLQPVLVRKASRVVSNIESIPEETNHEADFSAEQGADILIALGSIPDSQRTVQRNAFHQHLQSHDMSELITTANEGPMKPIDFSYQSFSCNWADEPMDNIEPMFAQSYDYQPSYTPWPPSLYDGYLPETAMQPPIDDYHNDYVNRHIAQRSSFNLGAEEYIPIAQAIVRPPAESRAIPIVRPEDAASPETDYEVDEAYGSDNRDASQEADANFDGYDGFDSGSEDSLHEESSHEPEDKVGSPEDTPNEERVRSFRFPSAHSAPATPIRPRTDLFDSASPEEKTHARAFSITLAPPAMSSTPRKSPRIFQKSVALLDTELDAIIMDLSIREAPGSPSDDFDSTIGSEASTALPDPQPALRKSSGKMFIPHGDADMGLLLDAMLTAKLAGVSDVLTGLQSNVAAIEARLEQAAPSNIETVVLEAVRKGMSSMNTSALDASKDQVAALSVQLDHALSMELQERTRTDATLEELKSATSALEQSRDELFREAQRASAIEKTLLEAQEALNAAQERLSVVDAAKSALQRSVGESTAKTARLESQLAESTTFCSALQAQYSETQLSLTKLRKELVEANYSREQALASLHATEEKYESLQQTFKDTALEVAQEQAKWQNSSQKQQSRLEDLESRLKHEEQRRHTTELDFEEYKSRHAKRDSFRRSIDLKTTIPQGDALLMERIRLLEEERLEAAVRYDRELTVRDMRLDSIMSEWRSMSVKLAQSEALNDTLRSETVVQADIEDRLRLDSARSDKLIGSLELLLEQLEQRQLCERSNRPVLSDGTSGDVNVITGDARPRRILGPVSENVDPSTTLKKSTAELKRMRVSWERVTADPTSYGYL